MDINSTITKLINKEIDKLGIPQTSLAENSGIAYSTLGRKLKGSGAWTATEIAGLAHALRVPAGDLLPAEFSQMTAAA